MINEANQRENILLQITQTQAYITLWQTEIVSGHYKSRNVFHGINGPKFTDEELLKDAMETLHRHVNRLRELVDAAMLPVDM
jgi:hypothetical protein